MAHGNFDLIFQIRAVTRSVEMSRGLHQLDLVARELLNLIAEREAESAPIRPSELVLYSRLGTAPTIYNRVARLEEAGWVVRAQDDQDARAIRLLLSASGRAAFKTMSTELTRRLSRG